MKRVPLTQGKVALVSDSDYWLVRQFKWCAHKPGGSHCWYAITQSDRKLIDMHRLIAGFPPFDLDHRNRNGLDNRRSNLRPATVSQNQANSRRPIHNTSGAKGVTGGRQKGKWRAQIEVKGKKIALGSYSTIAQASAVYQRAAKRYNGEFAP